jgi:hypothetical protein
VKSVHSILCLTVFVKTEIVRNLDVGAHHDDASDLELHEAVTESTFARLCVWTTYILQNSPTVTCPHAHGNRAEHVIKASVPDAQLSVVVVAPAPEAADFLHSARVIASRRYCGAGNACRREERCVERLAWMWQ